MLTYSTSLSRGSSDASGEGITEAGHALTNPTSALSANGQLVAGFFVGVGLTALILIVILGILIGVFLVLPLQAGCQRFLFLNLREPANVREVLLLLVIPGIVKAYEYRLVDYLLAENPALSSAEACEQSRALMDGNKWNAFVLDLSFIGWNILSLLTLGLVGLFYVSPYENSTNAALYEELRYGSGRAPALPQE